ITRNKAAKGKEILGIGVSCTNALVCADKDGKSLAPAIMQMDKRALHEAKYISDKIGDEQVFSITGNRIAPGTFSLPSILWIKENRGNIFKGTYKFLSPSGFIVGKLTGKFSIDITRACTTLLYDVREKKWSEEILSGLGISSEKLPDVYKSSEMVGEVDDRASKVTGLKKGIPVIAGAMDSVAAGTAINAKTRDESFIILGTVGRLCRVVENQALLKKDFLNTLYSDDGKYLSVACMDGTGISTEMFAREFGTKPAGKNIFEGLEREAQKSLPCSGGLIYLPYLMGERSPVWDPYAKGVFFGISSSSTRGDFYKAILEGIAYSIRANMEVFENDMLYDIKPLKIFESGIGESRFLQQIISDVMKREIVPCSVESPETFGISAIAALGIGAVKNTKKFVKSGIKVGKPVKPDKENGKKYENYFMMFKKLYDDLKGDFRIMYEIN
ncbi:MAG: hypothetical protein A2W05_02570, partial [Candidatus Schekmanbacteria bacterium RBG_16_38_10]